MGTPKRKTAVRQRAQAVETASAALTLLPECCSSEFAVVQCVLRGCTDLKQRSWKGSQAPPASSPDLSAFNNACSSCTWTPQSREVCSWILSRFKIAGRARVPTTTARAYVPAEGSRFTACRRTHRYTHAHPRTLLQCTLRLLRYLGRSSQAFNCCRLLS